MTGVMPIGNVLPDGGLATILSGPAQESLPVTVKNTGTGLLEVTTMLEGQLMDTMQFDGFTVTLKLQCCVLPQLSLAVACTGVVPIGNVLPLGGLATRNGGGLQPPEALTLKKTVAPLGPVAVVVILDEQDIVRG